jgi:hypothetical protein
MRSRDDNVMNDIAEHARVPDSSLQPPHDTDLMGEHAS